MGNYFIEILPEPLPGDGWTGFARFSRRNDYRRHASVTKVTLPSHILMPTMAAAGSAIVSWARELVEHSGEVLEVSLQLAEDTHT